MSLRTIKVTSAVACGVVGGVCAQVFDNLLVALLVGAPIVLLVSWIGSRMRRRILADQIVDAALLRYFQTPEGRRHLQTMKGEAK